RQRQFVGNAGVVDGERGRKHTVADDLVAARGGHHERGCSPAKGRAKIAVGHQVTPISLKTRMGGGRRSAAACQAKCGGPRGRLGRKATPADGVCDAGRSTCKRRVGRRWPIGTTAGSGGGAALHRLQCSQAWPGTRSGLPGASSPAATGPALWQITENGLTISPLAAIGAKPSRIT